MVRDPNDLASKGAGRPTPRPTPTGERHDGRSGGGDGDDAFGDIDGLVIDKAGAVEGPSLRKSERSVRWRLRRHSRTRAKAKSFEPFWYVLPAVIFIASMMVYPLVYLIDLSVRKASFLRPPMPYVGAANYVAVLTSGEFLNSLWQTLTWTAGSAVLTAALGLVCALLFNERFPGRTVCRVVVLLPWIFPYVAAAIMWRFLLTHPFGHFNAWLSDLGLLRGDAGALGSSDTAMIFAILLNVWKHFPFMMLMLLSGLQGIPREVYEASTVDGAGYLQQVRYVILPMLMPVFLVSVLIFIIWSLNAFSIVYLLTGGGPGEATEIITLFIYRLSFIGFEFGLAAAASLVLFAMGLAVGLAYVSRLRAVAR